MNWNRLGRRHVLRGLGAALTLPFLPSLLPKSARAEGPAKSFIGIAAYNGMYRLNNARNAAGFTGLAK